METGCIENDSYPDEEPTTSTDYRTLSGEFDDNRNNDETEDTTTITDFETVSVDFDADLDNDNYDAPTSLSEYQTPDVEPTTDGEYKCGFCICQFKTLCECLRHEILEHPKLQGASHGGVRTNQKHMLRLINRSNVQTERTRIHNLLQNCRPGTEMHEIFKIYCISDIRLFEIAKSVITSLLQQLTELKNVKVYTFGSMDNGLMMWDSDIDLYVSTYDSNLRYPDDRASRKLFQRINRILRRQQTCFDEVISLSRARVPLIKCRHLATGMKVDINCSCPTSMVSTQFLHSVLQFDVRLLALMRFLKIWAKQMHLIGQTQMNSYCLTILVLFFLQQKIDDREALLPSVHWLQTHVQPNFLHGINYAFQIYSKVHPLPVELTASTLVREFFCFYAKFDFQQYMIVPHLGVPVPKTDFISQNSHFYTLYCNQLNAMQAANAQSQYGELLMIDRCMLVIDPFMVNLNIARGVMPPHLNYFHKCIEYAFNVCTNNQISSDKQFLEALLFETIAGIENEAQMLRTHVGKNSSRSQPDELRYSFTPSRSEMHALTMQQLKISADTEPADKTPTIHFQWVNLYIDSIHDILKEIYLLDVKSADETNAKDVNEYSSPEQEAMQHTHQLTFMEELEEKEELIWLLSGSIDTWSGRCFQRNGSQTFFDYQIVQTKNFQAERKENKNFQAIINGKLFIKVPKDCKIIELALKHIKTDASKSFTKKDPLRKFFTNFKCSMQNFNFKERIQAKSRNNSQQDMDISTDSIKVHIEQPNEDHNNETNNQTAIE